MSNTYPDTVVGVAEPLPIAAPRRRHWSIWLKWLFAILAMLWIGDFGVSLLIQHTNLRNRLTAHLAAAFGRPVVVSSYEFTLWGGPALIANSVSVADDPRFGSEYFLRSDSVTARLRWQSLLRGHIELGTISLSRPSLTVARNSSGEWNLAGWLPDPSQPSRVGAPARPFVLHRIEVDGGRMNFKIADDKLPFAFIGVEGALETDSPGIWRINLQAAPWRAAEILQQAGTIHVSGHVGGTSSRLLPAALDLSWSDASISDVLRLVRSYDYGVRGAFALSLSARTEGEAWILQARTEVSQLHRWDLALRQDNPAVDLIAKMKLYPAASGVEISDARIEAPGSSARASGSLSWAQPAGKRNVHPSTSTIQLSSEGIDLSDVLSWVRAFHSGVSGDLLLHGYAAGDATFTGWPPRIASADLSTLGADLGGVRLRVPVRVGPAEFHYDSNRAILPSVAISFGRENSPAIGSFRVDASEIFESRRNSALHISGNTLQVADLIVAAGQLGWNLSRGWDLVGPLRCDLKWQQAGPDFPWMAQPVGFVELGSAGSSVDPATGAALKAPFLNLAVDQIRARADWKPGTHHITLASARAFGARWSGSFDRHLGSPGGVQGLAKPGASARAGTPADAGHWQFSLAADHVSASDLDRWLNPRWRESFLDRMLPFLNSRSAATAVPESLRAAGHISLDEFMLAPYILRRLQGDLKVDGRRVELDDAQAQFYGGDVSGSVTAELLAAPVYRIAADFSGVDLSSLTAPSDQLGGLFDGSASGNISLNATGASRADLLASLECRGAARVARPEIETLDLAGSLSAAAVQPGKSVFRDGSAAFVCTDRKLMFDDLLLLSPKVQIGATGTVDFDRNLNFRLRSYFRDDSESTPEASEPPARSFQLTGTLAAPQIANVPPPARPHR